MKMNSHNAVVCPDCKIRFPLPEPVVENIRAGKPSLRPKNNILKMRRKDGEIQVPVVVYIEQDEHHELTCLANECGITCEELIISHLQALT
jgi:hypothetical protein